MSELSSETESFVGFISDTVKPQISDESDLHNLALHADFLLANSDRTDSITEI